MSLPSFCRLILSNYRYHLNRNILNFSTLSPTNELLKNPATIQYLKANMLMREGYENITKIQKLTDQLNVIGSDRKSIETELQREINRIPNDTHPIVKDFGEHPSIVDLFGEKPLFKFEPKSFANISKKLNICRTEHLGNFSGTKSYYLMNDLADLEQALIEYTVSFLLKSGFQLISVPDFLTDETIENCGMTVNGERTQVYRVDPSSLCLSGTAEMSLAGYFAGKTLSYKVLPIKVAAVSRCFRAETSRLQEERGIYRVHTFTKVEMFSVCQSNESDKILNQFKDTEIELFESLDLHFKLLDMPPCELGLPAYRKYDIEAWLPSKINYGEISSCSNCTDYQSKRLDIKYIDETEQENWVHTVNGTACAVPRMLIAILENNQNENGSVNIPHALKPFVSMPSIQRSKSLPELKLIKNMQQNG